jgi:hypothetical protein
VLAAPLLQTLRCFKLKWLASVGEFGRHLAAKQHSSFPGFCTDHHVTLNPMQDPCSPWYLGSLEHFPADELAIEIDYRKTADDFNSQRDSLNLKMSASQRPIRLPPLKTLRVRTPNAKPERPCMSILSSVLCKFALRHHQPTLAN